MTAPYINPQAENETEFLPVLILTATEVFIELIAN